MRASTYNVLHYSVSCWWNFLSCFVMLDIFNSDHTIFPEHPLTESSGDILITRFWVKLTTLINTQHSKLQVRQLQTELKFNCFAKFFLPHCLMQFLQLRLINIKKNGSRLCSRKSVVSTFSQLENTNLLILNVIMLSTMKFLFLLLFCNFMFEYPLPLQGRLTKFTNALCH